MSLGILRAFFFALLLLTARAWAGSEPAHFKGALTSDTPVRLLNAAAYFDEDGALAEPELEIAKMTKQQLEAELERLQKSQPAIGGPVAMVSVGGGLLIISFVILYVDFLLWIISGFGGAGFAGVGIVLVLVAAAFAITGGILLAVGVVNLIARMGERREISQRIDDINARLEKMHPDSNEYEPVVPPPPPLPPPGVHLFPVQPTLVVARF